LAALAFSGCIGSDDGGPAGIGEDAGGQSLILRALVVDPEFFPVPGASVSAQPGDLEAVSDLNGSVTLRPVPPDTELQVHVERQGYASLDLVVTVGAEAPEELAWVLEPVSRDVPYHETIPHTVFIDCAWAAPIGTLPCNVVDRQLGTNLTMDRSQWFFEIPSPGLASLLQESVWDANAVGSDMRFLIFHPDLVTGSAVGGETYLDGRGGSPFRTMMIPGEHADRADVLFNGTQGFLYQALYRPWYSNSTTGIFAAYVNHRVDNYYTFFYHREGALDYTALPDE
jgi:hypothetical protein